MLSVITDCNVLIIVFNSQFCVEFTLTTLYAICSSIYMYGQCTMLLKLLYFMFHHLRSMLYVFTSLSVQEFLTTLYTNLEA